MTVCVVGASGKLGRYMVQHALDRGYEVVGVCRAASVSKLDAFKGRMTVVSGATNDREVVRQAVAGCDGVLTVLVPWGVQQYATGTAQAVEACRRIFASDRRWTVARGSDLDEGESEGLPVWSHHVGDPILKSNRTRRIDFALFMVAALANDALTQQAPAIVGCRTPSALAHQRTSNAT